MPAPPSSKQRAQNSASMGGAGGTSGRTSTGKMGVSSGKMGAKSSQSGAKGNQTGAKAPAKAGNNQPTKMGPTRSGQTVAAPKIGGNLGVASGKMGARSGQTALGKVSQAAKTLTPAQNQARINAVSRGPGISAGLVGGAKPSEFTRTAISYGLANMDRLGVTDPKRITASLNNIKQFADVSYDQAGIDRVQRSLGYTPVGIRTNNPGNILNSNWQKGMPGYTGPVTSPNGLTYSSYSDPRWGLVAQNELLGRYSDMGRNTIRSVVDRYAPTDENNSAAANRNYKASLANATGWGLDQALTREQVQSLGPHKTAFENAGRVFAGGPFGPGSVQVASAAPTAIPRPTPRPSGLGAPVPRPTPRPNDLFTGNIARNAFDTQRAVGVPRARPPGVGPERIMGVETYIDPASTVTRNPYEDRALAQYSGYGQFNTPANRVYSPGNRWGNPTSKRADQPGGAPVQTADVSRNPFDTRAPASYSGFGSPFASLPAAPQKPPRLTPQYAGAIDGPMPKQFYDRIMPTAGPIPQMVKDQSRVPAYPGSTPAGTYTAPYNPEPRMSPFGNVGQEYHQHTAPPAPWQYRNEAPPAAPHPGTPGSQTAQSDTAPSFWQQGADLFNQASTAVKEQVAPKVNEYFDTVNKVGLPGVRDYANQQAGIVPRSLTDPGPGARNPIEVMAAAQAMMGGQPAPAAPQPSQAELMALVEAMRLKGATPEEIVYVQSLISEQTA